MVRTRWAVLAAGIALAVLGALWGTGVLGTLSSNGFDDPGSESVRARERIVAEIGRQDADVVALYTSADLTVDDPRFQGAVQDALARVRQRAEVARVVSFYDTGSPALVSADRHATYAAITMRTADNDEDFKAIRPDLRATGAGIDTEVGGHTAIFADVSDQVGKDIGHAELLSMPILLVLLILVFRSVVAAMMPLLVGGLAILGAFIVTRLLASVTEVSVFALNIITLMGLGMAVDYALFVVSRFREELAAGHAVPQAIARTLATAGRTVLVSGLTVAFALSSLLLFPQAFLRSMGLGGMAAVLVGMLVALTVLPAVLAILGTRINALRVPLPQRDRSTTGGVWARIAHAVMRRPVPVIVAVVAVLGILASPFLRAEFGAADERVLPAGTSSRVVSERLDAEFPGGGEGTLTVLVSGADRAAADAFAGDVGRLDGVTRATVTATKGASSVISVGYAGPLNRRLVVDVRALPAPPGAQVLVGGAAAEVEDRLHSLGGRLPYMALVAAAGTMLLLFLAFGSLVLPIKAVLMNLVSIGASFGAIVWIFQDGHLSDVLGFTATGDLEASQLVLILAVLFGLSTDYEVFLLSRVREEWDRTGDNTAAVATGLQRTGAIITSAALLLIVVVGGFATGGISFIKMIGVGMIIALVVDATIVRALLVPATMRLLGRANWWLPAPLLRVYRRFGIRESSPAPTTTPVDREPARSATP
ncbi:MMPL family transporter [Dactylosporangium sp. NPDC049525]|uniref:MMPL family transporter n=1 Tax=Dactylosporangium sp. NPDC049525 TaxID=3154730 RepID=UPI003435E724